MNELAGLLGMLPIILAGKLIFELLFSDLDLLPSQRWSLAWAMGTGCLTLILFYFSLIADQHAFLITAILLSILSLIYLLSRRRTLANFSWPTTKRRLTTEKLVLLIVVILFSALLVWTAGNAGLGHDGYGQWGLKAKVIFVNGGWPLRSDSYAGLPYPDYPLLVPSQQGWVYTIANSADEHVASGFFVAFYIALTILFYGAVRRIYRPILAFIYTLLMVTTPLLTLATLSGYADVPLMLFVFAAAFFIWRWLKDGRQLDLLAGAIFAAFSILAKKEGFVYWSVNLFFVLAFLLWQRQLLWKTRAKQVGVFIVPAILIAGSWFAFVIISDLPNSNFSQLTLATILSQTDRIELILDILWGELVFTIGKWGILWLLLLIAAVWRWRKLSNPANLYLLGAVLFPIIILTSAYYLSSWEALEIHVGASIDRILMQIVPIAWLFIAVQTDDLDHWYERLVNQRVRSKQKLQTME